MFPFQVGVIQMAADKTMLKKKKQKAAHKNLCLLQTKIKTERGKREDGQKHNI